MGRAKVRIFLYFLCTCNCKVRCGDMRCFSPVLVNQLGKEGLTSRATDDRTPDARELRMGRVTVRSPGIIFYLEDM